MEPIVRKEKRITLEELQQLKREVLMDIRIQKETINQTVQGIVGPFTKSSNSLPSVKSFNTGIAVFDGILMGYKIIKKIRGFFKKKR